MIYSFIHQSKQFSIHYFDGTKFINETLKFHRLKKDQSTIFIKLLLGTVLLNVQTRPNEGIGLYLDSKNFNFKIESNYKGHTRTLFSPKDLAECPELFSANCMVSRIISPAKKSEIFRTHLQNIDTNLLITTILKKIYSTNGRIITSSDQNSSILITKLPDSPNHTSISEKPPESITEFISKINTNLIEILNHDISQEYDLIILMKELDFKIRNRRAIELEPINNPLSFFNE